MRRKYEVRTELAVSVEMDDAVYKAVLTKEWRSRFYPLHSVGDVVRHVTLNILQGRKLSSLDGFANLSDDLVRVAIPDWGEVEVEGARGGVVR